MIEQTAEIITSECNICHEITLCYKIDDDFTCCEYCAENSSISFLKCSLCKIIKTKQFYRNDKNICDSCNRKSRRFGDFTEEQTRHTTKKVDDSECCFTDLFSAI